MEIPIKNLQQELIELAKLSTKHDDELGMILNSFSTFQSSPQKLIWTVTDRVDLTEDSKLGGTEMSTGLPEKLILESKVEELDMDHINDRLRIDGLESHINAGTDEMQVGEVIIRYP